MSSRLPTTVTPSHYALTYTSLNLLAPPYEFTGALAVTVAVSELTEAVTLHCLDLSVDSCSLDGDNVNRIVYDVANQSVTLTFSAPLAPTPPGSTSTLTFTFTGHLNDSMRGLYRSTYTSLTGQQRIMATTQFEATDARRAFPCWDEPALKATFELTVTIPLLDGRNVLAVSNTPVSETAEFVEGESRFKTYTFEDTPKM